MNKIILSRKLWYVEGANPVWVDQTFLQADPRPLVVLGEAGMGKSTLLEQLKYVEGHIFCTARKLINTAHPKALLGDATTIVIDALDEVAAQRDGDAVDQVLRKLGLLGNPRFILACRVADWRSATALQGIVDLYDCKPLELHLEPLNREDAVTILAKTLGVLRAGKVMDHLESRGLSGLWSNPHTLELVEEVGRRDELPASKGDLFTKATKLLCKEHREEKADTPFAVMSEAEVLDAAGAAFATFILAGKDALSRLVNCDDDDLPIREVATLPAASRIGDVLNSRLFAARGIERFSYAHRAIGEFLGARWLVRTADTPRKRRRLLGLFSNQTLVPASLRGLHAWLAWHGTEIAPLVIAADPMGVVEYGDADKLSPDQGRTLFAALRSLSRDNPRFRGWAEYRVSGLIQIQLLPEIQEALTHPDVEFGLQLLILQALKGSSLVRDLEDTLRDLLLDPRKAFTNRAEAGKRLATLEPALDWPRMIKQLRAQDVPDGVRLASELMAEVGFEHFDDALVLDVVLAQLGRKEDSVEAYFVLKSRFPAERLDALLTGICKAAARLGTRHERAHNREITDLAYGLLARRLDSGSVDAAQLWLWLQPFDSEVGYIDEARDAISEFLSQEHSVRRAVQRLVLLQQSGDTSILERSFWLTKGSLGFAPTEEDVVALLDELERDDPRWRDLVQLVPHASDQGVMVRVAAARFVTPSATDAAWLAQISEPRVPEWQINQEKDHRKRQEERHREWQQDRAQAAEQIDALRAGEFHAIIRPAGAYLNLIRDLGLEAHDGPARLDEWLGLEFRDACLDGFEAFLTSTQPYPTATDIAQSHAEGQQWNTAPIIVAALAQRLRTGRGFVDLPDERLLAGLFEVRHMGIHNDAGIDELKNTLEETLRARGVWEPAQRLYFEPQLARHRKHITGLYELMHDTRDAELSAILALDWLERFPNMAADPEAELIDRLLAMPAGHRALRSLVPLRRGATMMCGERRRNWDAIGLIVDFETTRTALERPEAIERELFWNIRARLGHRRHDKFTARLDVRQLAWIFRAFRSLYPAIHRPSGVTMGDTNPWDATEHMSGLINRLGDEISNESIEALTALRDAPPDGYTELLRVVSAEQRRKRVEADWVAPDFSTIATAISDGPPTTPAQLQAVLIEELEIVQGMLRGSDVNWYRDFSQGNAGGAPRVEDDCRDTILKMMRPLPFGIQAVPEGHLADKKRCDIICMLGDAMVPIEIKGQWHPQLWSAADNQLDRLYVNDWRAERGIYLVLWFGLDSAKPPTTAPSRSSIPQTATEMKVALAAASASARQGRTEVVVLDLTRPG